MMYSEFIELSGKSESYISYNEYSIFIEPVYMECSIFKKDFIKILNDAFELIVYPAVKKAIHNLSMNEKWDMIECNSESVRNKIEKVDFEARKIAYNYVKLFANL